MPSDAPFADHAAAPTPTRAAAQAAVLARFDQRSHYEGDGLRNHSVRVYEFTRMIMEAEGIDFDDDAAFGIAMFHDLGLTLPRGDSMSYMHRSLDLLHEDFPDLVGKVDADVVSECMLLNHRVSPVPNCSAAAEAFRKAVWVEHTRGLRRYGLLSRESVRDVFARHPRANLDRVLLDFFWLTVRNEPRTITNGIFF